MLDTVRFLAGLSWTLVFFFLAGSPYRVVTGNVRNWRDRQWVMLWFISFLFVCYFLRFVFGLTPEPETGPQHTVTMGLQVFSLLLALRILHYRIELQGWRW